MSETPQDSQGIRDRVSRVIDGLRPYIQGDGGDIELVDIDEQKRVHVRLMGACRGCPSAAMTLKMGVERALRAEIPEITEVVNVQ